MLEALDQIAVSSATIKGRKNLIWFTVGIPAITDPNERPGCLPDYSAALTHAYDRLTAAQVSIYPIDAIGVSPLTARQLSEQSVAEATGGVAYSESNYQAAAVLKAISNGANYYSIAYTPPREKYDGAYHKIDVKVDRPGVNLVFRKGYYADDLSKDKLPPALTFSMTPPPAYAGNMKAPMSRGMATSQQILFDAGVERSTIPPKPGDPPILGTLAANLAGQAPHPLRLLLLRSRAADHLHPRPQQHPQSRARLRHRRLRLQRQAAHRPQPDRPRPISATKPTSSNSPTRNPSASPSRSTSRPASSSSA